MKPDRAYYEFGNFRLVPDDGALYQNGEPKAVLSNKVLALLVLFLESDGRVLSREEIMQTVWRDTQVEAANLKQSIYLLRKILGETEADEHSETFIKTLPRRGYRFLAPVRVVIAAPVVEQSTSFAAIEEHTVTDVTIEEEITEDDADEAAKPALPPAEHARPRWQSLVIAGLVGSVFLAVLGFGLYSLMNRGSRKDDSRKMSSTRLTSNGKVQYSAISPDGKFIAFVTEEEGKQSFWLKNVGAEGERQFTLPEESARIYNLVFSPDSNYIFYTSKGMLYKISVLGDAPKKVLSSIYNSPISFSPDGKQFVYLVSSTGDNEKTDLVIADADGSVSERILATSRRPNMFILSPAWSPDGKVIACPISNASGETGIVTVRVSDGEVSPPLPLPVSWSPNLWQIIWKPDGSGLLVCVEEDKNILTQIWSLSYPGGEAHRVTDDSHNYKSISLSADGRSLVTVRAEQEAHLWLMPGTGESNQAKQITSGFEKYDGVLAINWTNADEIIYENAPSGRPAVWRTRTDGSGAKGLSAEGKWTVVSPDGKSLIYQLKESGQIGLFRVNLEDGEKKRLTTGADESPAISPDGKWIVFTRYADDIALWKVPADGSGEAVKLTDFNGYPQSASFSPDGKFIAFYRGTNGPKMSFPQLAVIAFDSGAIVKEFDAVIQFLYGVNAKSAVQWSSDGKSIYYIPWKRQDSNIWRQSVDGGAPVQITNFESGLIFNFAFSPDSKQLAVSRGTFNSDVVLITNPE